MEKKENKNLKSQRKEKGNSEDLPYDPNINSDDMQALQDENLSMDQNQDKPLADREDPVDFTGKDLDIPGRNEADTTHEGTDIPDEDNLQFNERGATPAHEKKQQHPNREDDPLLDEDEKERG